MHKFPKGPLYSYNAERAIFSMSCQKGNHSPHHQKSRHHHVITKRAIILIIFPRETSSFITKKNIIFIYKKDIVFTTQRDIYVMLSKKIISLSYQQSIIILSMKQYQPINRISSSQQCRIIIIIIIILALHYQEGHHCVALYRFIIYHIKEKNMC